MTGIRGGAKSNERVMGVGFIFIQFLHCNEKPIYVFNECRNWETGHYNSVLDKLAAQFHFWEYMNGN